MKVGPRETLSAAELRERFRSWLVQRGLERDGYDFFLSESYRWTPLDEELALRLYSELGARGNEASRTFLDKMRLEPGRNFARDFAAALCWTRIGVGLLSAAALERMAASEGTEPDLDKEVRARSPGIYIYIYNIRFNITRRSRNLFQFHYSN